MTQTHHYDYASARQAFLNYTQSARVESHIHPLQGPDGEIAMDIAFFGKDSAPKAFVISSGTHGVEGYCGSFIQCELLKQGIVERLPSDMQLVMVHGVNPHGFAWRRRVNEDNIDLNRNFVDHTQHSVNKGYAELADTLEPKQWGDSSAQQLWSSIFAAAARHEDDPGWQGMALTSGQHQYPHGVFYGGIKPAWSNLRIRAVAEQLKGQQVTWIDIHTALGPYGEAECIVEYEPGAKPLERAQALWGARVKNTKTNESISADIAGSISVGTHQSLGDDLVLGALEYGTLKGKAVLEAIIADQWLARYGDLDSDKGRQIKQQIVDAFYPDDPKWRESVLAIALDIVEPVLSQ